MLTRRVRIQVVLFVIIAIAGVAYMGLRFAGLDRLVGADGYRVTVQLANSGGISPNAAVAYRGVTVGEVAKLRVADYGTAVELQIKEGAPPIPADARAVVTNRSAIGEQYVDLRPVDGRGPYLHDGSVIDAAHTAVPLPIEKVMMNVDKLVRSVPTDSLRTVVDELGSATQGSGPAMRTIIDSSDALMRTATEHLPQTKDLIANSRIALQTQVDQADNIRTFATGLRDLSGQLKRSDTDLRRIITSAQPAADEVRSLIRETGPDLGVLIANLLTTSNITRDRIDGVEQALVSYPALMGLAPTVVPGDGTAHLGMVFNVFDPMPCTKGYEGTRLRPGNETTTQRYNPDTYCAEPPGSPTSVRGAQNAPRGGG